MTYEIKVDKDFFNKLEKSVQEFLKNISPTTKEITFYLKNHTPEGKVEKDLCQMMNEMIIDKELTNAEKFLIKSYYGLHHEKNESFNQKSYKNISNLTQNNFLKTFFQIKYATNKIRNSNKEMLNYYISKLEHEEEILHDLKKNGIEKFMTEKMSICKVTYVNEDKFKKEYLDY